MGSVERAANRAAAASDAPITDLSPLRANLTGEVLEPGAPGYEAARKPAMARFAHIRPLAMVRCGSADDVARTFDFARRSGQHVAPRGGGHCFAGRSSTAGLLLDLTPMPSISVSSNGVAVVGAGAKLAALHDALDGHGPTLPAGCDPTVGIAGLTLGGGLGILGPDGLAGGRCRSRDRRSPTRSWPTRPRPTTRQLCATATR